MKFVINARKGRKRKIGQIYFRNVDIKLNIFGTVAKEPTTKKLFYDMLKLIIKYYDLEYVDRPTSHTGKAGHSGRMKRIVIDETEQLIDKLMNDPSLKELKGRIMADSDEVRKKQRDTKPYYQFNKGTLCIDCDKLISNQSIRCNSCAGKNTMRKRQMLKTCEVCNNSKIATINKRICPFCGAKNTFKVVNEGFEK